MNTSSKKWTYVVLLLVVLVGAAAAWFVFLSTPTQKESVQGLFPFFGESQDEVGNQANNTPDTSPNEGDIFAGGQGRQPILYKLHNLPVAGIVTYSQGNTPYARYIERGLGHVYETNLSTLTESQVSIETIPGIQDAAWSSDGSSVVTRRSNDTDPSIIETYALRLPPSGDSPGGETTGVFLPQNIVGVASQGNNIFYLAKTSSGVVGNVSSFDGENRRQIFTSPFTEWLASWPAKDTLVLATKPSNGVDGHIYTLSSSGALTRKIASIPGITGIANDTLSTILYLSGEGSGKGYTMHLFDTKTNETTPFNFFTMPEKCTWSKVDAGIVYCALPDSVPPGIYPDDWYQGVVSFSDSLWRINLETQESTRIIGLSDQGSNPMDATQLSLDENDATLSFINKRDGSPWRVLLDQTAFGGFVPVTNDPTQPES